MPRTPCSSQPLVDLIRELKVVMYADLQNALGPVSRQTVYRKMLEIGVRSSYSHGGRYYTLDECANYDTDGLWSHHGIHFSLDGTLKDTLAALIEAASAGRFARDLKASTQVEVAPCLTLLHQTGRVSRTKMGDHYLYCSKNAARRRRQERNYLSPLLTWDDQLQLATDQFYGTLNEQQRRLFAGFLSLLPGSGGDQRISEQLGIARATTTKGRKQLLSGDIVSHGVRRPGGGRKPIEKKPPNATNA